MTDLLQQANAELQSVPLLHRADMAVLELGRGYVKAKMPIEGNGNHFGVMYAGNLYSLSEYLGAGVLIDAFDFSKVIPLVKHSEIDYLAPAMGDVFAELQLDEAELQRIADEVSEKGKSEYVIEPELKTADGTVVARAKGVYQMRSIERMPGR